MMRKGIFLLIVTLAVRGSTLALADAVHIPSLIPEARTIWEFMDEYTGDDKVTRLLNSFAVGSVDGCSGTMISPHIFMTAAHCGGPDHSRRVVKFFRIDEDTTPSPQNQTLSEPYVGRSFPWQRFIGPTGTQIGDTMLWWLEDGSDGIPPGVKYGYLQLSLESVSVGDQAYSFWVNSVDDYNLSSTLLHSFGSATVLGSETGGAGPPMFTDYDIYGVPGASGSSVIGTGKHGHQAIGVTATAATTWRRAADTSSFLDAFDADNNDVLDAVEYDLLLTTSSCDFYRLEFDTPLQWAQWRLAPGSTSSITSGPGFWVGHIVGAGDQQPHDGLWHSIARFVPNATYRISIVVYGLSEDGAPPYVAFRSDSGGPTRLLPFQSVLNGWKRITGSVNLGNRDDYRLIIGEAGDGSYYVDSIAVVREDGGAGLNFETGEERRSWEYVAGPIRHHGAWTGPTISAA